MEEWLKDWQNDALDARATRKEIAELLRHVGYRESREARHVVRTLEGRWRSGQGNDWGAGLHSCEIRYGKNGETRDAVMVSATSPRGIVLEVRWEEEEVVVHGDTDPGPGIIRTTGGDADEIIKLIDEVEKLISRARRDEKRAR